MFIFIVNILMLSPVLVETQYRCAFSRQHWYNAGPTEVGDGGKRVEWITHQVNVMRMSAWWGHSRFHIPPPVTLRQAIIKTVLFFALFFLNLSALYRHRSY
jgi:hypothetical protein